MGTSKIWLYFKLPKTDQKGSGPLIDIEYDNRDMFNYKYIQPYVNHTSSHNEDRSLFCYLWDIIGYISVQRCFE